MADVKQGRVSDLTPDNKNFNKHTDTGLQMLQKSIEQFGFGRSVLVDKNDRIIGGNGVCEMAGDADTIVVETTGDKLVVVKRTDVDLDSKQGREMALADNATAAADLQWDVEQLQACVDEFDMDVDGWGVEPFNIEDVAVGEKLIDQLEAQIYIEKENYFVKKPFVVIFYEESEKRDLGDLLGVAIENDTYTYEQLRKGNTNPLSE